jgi:hypothetical protein
MNQENKLEVLFILKKRTLYSQNTYSTVNSGLYNSANFVNEMLIGNGIKCGLIDVDNYNQIDKYVTLHRPKIVIIEALWVVAAKFGELQKRHPNVIWVIRIHSEVPFIANEGIAIKWMKEYMAYDNVILSANSRAFKRSLEPILGKDILYLPNYYPDIKKVNTKCVDDNFINVGLFGAIRPMKNSLTQAIAAMIYADKTNKILNLHINTARVEQNGDSALKNVRELFEGTKHNLVEHDWLNHSDFIKVVATMDIGLQVSLSETYNIVTADCISQCVPVVTSKEIPFVNIFNIVRETKDAIEISDNIGFALRFKKIFTFMNKILLKFNSCTSERIWMGYIKETLCNK